ncbi:MAG: 30S ribosomal protein S12 methylthiotransferase RimO, partial [Leptospiraceae bacterium]|nr:30S ribosomal protein S12 methylthiotransferase RimO [Leptospiraceae bacterium]
MRIALLQHGFREATDPERADFYLINSCSFIREAQEETIETVFAALKLKERKAPQMKVGLIGCFAERFPDAVRKEIPELDFVLGTQRYHEVGALLARRFGIQARHQAEVSAASTCPDFSKPFAWLRIAQGC